MCEVCHFGRNVAHPPYKEIVRPGHKLEKVKGIQPKTAPRISGKCFSTVVPYLRALERANVSCGSDYGNSDIAGGSRSPHQRAREARQIAVGSSAIPSLHSHDRG